jgi:hypothetical protein
VHTISAAREIEESHPRWRVWQSEASDIWWAAVATNLTADQARRGATPFICAATVGELVALMDEEDAQAAG